MNNDLERVSIKSVRQQMDYKGTSPFPDLERSGSGTITLTKLCLNISRVLLTLKR